MYYLFNYTIGNEFASNLCLNHYSWMTYWQNGKQNSMLLSNLESRTATWCAGSQGG